MQKAIVTGGNKGIGLETTKILLGKGYKVTVIARDFSKFELKDHPNIKIKEFDMMEIDKIPQLIGSIDEVDILINNAGVMYTLPYDKYPKEKIDSIMNINLYAPIKMIEECAKYMQRKGGRIVNNASVSAHTGHPDIWYGMSKSALVNATISFAKLFEGKIILNSVAPSPVETDMQKSNSKERKEAFKQNVISKRFAEPKEIAKAIVWLATESPEYINGICLDINNGSYPR